MKLSNYSVVSQETFNKLYSEFGRIELIMSQGSTYIFGHDLVREGIPVLNILTVPSKFMKIVEILLKDGYEETNISSSDTPEFNKMVLHTFRVAIRGLYINVYYPDVKGNNISTMKYREECLLVQEDFLKNMPVSADAVTLGYLEDSFQFILQEWVHEAYLDLQSQQYRYNVNSVYGSEKTLQPYLKLMKKDKWKVRDTKDISIIDLLEIDDSVIDGFFEEFKVKVKNYINELKRTK